MTALNAKDLSLNEAHRFLGFQRQYNPSFTSLLSLEPLSEFENRELRQIRDDFDHYIADSKVCEGMVKALTIFSLQNNELNYSPDLSRTP